MRHIEENEEDFDMVIDHIEILRELVEDAMDDSEEPATPKRPTVCPFLPARFLLTFFPLKR